MKCIILCGGRGVIDPETHSRIPKCLLKFGNRPLVWHIMKLYSSFGVNDFILALGHGGDQVKSYFINSFEFLHDIEVNVCNAEVKALNKIPEENWNIKLVDTGVSANTGARIARCERFVRHETFFISYSDVLADVNIEKLLKFHQQQNKTLTITGVQPVSRFGSFQLNNEGVIAYNAFSKIEMIASRINGGFMVANSDLFKTISPISECNLETEVFELLLQKKQLALCEHDGFWQNIDTERELHVMQELYVKNKRPWLGIN